MGLQPVGTQCIRDATVGAALRRATRRALCGALSAACIGLAPGLACALNVAHDTVALRDDRGRTVTVALPARRIVSLLPSLTESVCALGACERLVGVDRSSDWPVSVRTLPRMGGLEDPAVERIVALRPDLVLAPVSWRATPRLEAAGLTVLALEPDSMDQTRRTLEVLAQALGQPAAASRLWTALQEQIARAGAQLPAGWRGARTYVEVSDVPHAASPASPVGELVAALGLGNVVPPALGPYPRLNPEFIVRADPGLIIAPRESLARMGSRPGWSSLSAVREQRWCGLSPQAYDALVRPGPRLGEAAQALVNCLRVLPLPTAPALR